MFFISALIHTALPQKNQPTVSKTFRAPLMLKLSGITCCWKIFPAGCIVSKIQAFLQGLNWIDLVCVFGLKPFTLA